jgi:hypothetical protein
MGHGSMARKEKDTVDADHGIGCMEACVVIEGRVKDFNKWQLRRT